MSSEAPIVQSNAVSKSGQLQILVVGLMSAALLVTTWVFPRFWYHRGLTPGEQSWLATVENLPDWNFTAVPVTKAAEAVLAADRTCNGEFTNKSGMTVRIFAAQALSDRRTAAMFAHTPDRCWTSTGWQLIPVTPEWLQLDIHGTSVTFERRLFRSGSHQELVYFAALVGGRPLPNRLDQYFDLGLRQSRDGSAASLVQLLAGSFSGRFLFWPWKVFLSRMPLTGPKQFFRISAPVQMERIGETDALLQEFLKHWLRPSHRLDQSADSETSDTVP